MEKQEKQETFPTFENLTQSKIFGRLRIPIYFGGIYVKYGNTKCLEGFAFQYFWGKIENMELEKNT